MHDVARRSATMRCAMRYAARLRTTCWGITSGINRVGIGPLLVAAIICLIPTAAVASTDPPGNLPLVRFPFGCHLSTAPVCSKDLVYALDQARAALGLGPYQVPHDFLSLPSDEKLFILANLDRTVEGAAPLPGLNSELDTAASEGASRGVDPVTPPGWDGYSSNWGAGSPLVTYYIWMYDDGFASGNVDCQTQDARGCWGHRHVILDSWPSDASNVGLGVGSGLWHGQASEALIVGRNPLLQTPYYTWAQAVADGAGTNSFASGPTLFLVNLHLTFAGDGRGYTHGNVRCTHSCARTHEAAAHTQIVAAPLPGSQFAGWSGPCTGKQPVCRFTPEADTTVTVRFNLLRAKHRPSRRSH